MRHSCGSPRVIVCVQVAVLLCALGLVVGELTRRGLPPDECVFVAANAGEWEVVSRHLMWNEAYILEAGYPRGFTLLHIAACEGNVNAMGMLLSRGADVNARGVYGETPLMCAARVGAVNAVECLLTKEAQIDAHDRDGNTALHWACGEGHTDIADVLIANGAGVAVHSVYGMTPLEHAVIGCSSETVKLLAAHGADVNAGEAYGRPILSLALPVCRCKDVSGLIGELIACGANISARDAVGATPLHNAVALGALTVAEIMICHGADVNATDRDGYTPLHRVIVADELSGNVRSRIAVLLINNGADLSAKTVDGRTPMGVALDKRVWDIVEVIRRGRIAGARRR